MTLNCFLVQIIALAAQNVRETTGRTLLCAQIHPFALLRQIEQALACAHHVFESHRVLLLRESLEAACPDGVFPAALVLFDVCEALDLDEPDTQRALSLADWSDVQRALASDLQHPEVATMSP